MKNMIIIIKALTTNVDTLYELTKKHSKELDELTERVKTLEETLYEKAN